MVPSPEHFNIPSGLTHTYCTIENEIYYIIGVEVQGRGEWGYGKLIGLAVRKIEPEYAVINAWGGYLQTPLVKEDGSRISMEEGIKELEELIERKNEEPTENFYCAHREPKVGINAI